VIDLSTVIPYGVWPSDVVFWTGAGTSADRPSNLLLGDAFAQDVVDTYCLSGVWDKLRAYYSDTLMTDAYGGRKGSPRLESVMESVMSVHGIGALDAFRQCFDAEPNPSHGFLARHFTDDGVVLTANFDNCIEKALYPAYAGVLPGVLDDISRGPFQSLAVGCLVHFHGGFDTDPDKRRLLGVRIRNISAGFPKAFKAWLASLLRAKSFLVFAGYSGRDYFDVNPFFRELADSCASLRHLRAVWLKHDRRPGFFEAQSFSGQEQGKAILSQLAKCGADIRYVETDTGEFLRALSGEWWGPHSWNVPPTSSWPRFPIAPAMVSSDARLVATAQLFSSMGIGHEIVSLKGSLEKISGPMTERVAYLLGDAYRNLGYYRKALRYSRSLPRTGILERMLRHERIAGDHWLRRSYLRAAWHFYRAIVRYPKGLSKLPLKDRRRLLHPYYEAIITFLHYYRDFRRIRAIAWLAPKSLAVRAFRKLFQAKSYLRHSLASKAKAVRLYHEIPGMKKLISLPTWLHLDITELISPFQETDSILGVINFTRRRMTAEMEDGKKPDRAELELLLKRSKAIHDRPGMLKATLLLKQQYGCKDPDAMKALREIEWTLLSKIAWLAEWHLP
jgi:hypothetical protein